MTRTTTTLLSCTAAMALTACSREPVASPAAEEPIRTPVATVTETASATPEPAGAALPMPGPSPVQPIPVAIQGRWGLVPADCTTTRGDAKGLMTIDATTLKFYESRGTLGKIAERSDTRIRATFAYSGEGMSWTRDTVFDVQDSGKTLIRRENGKNAAPGPFRYARCPE